MAGQFASLAGRRVVSGRITIPYYGIWVADVILSVADTIPTQTTLTVADLTLQCAIYRQISFAGSRSARVVGGFGGWRQQVPAQGYQTGVLLSTVLRDAATAVGEKIKVTTDKTLPAFTREAAPASRLLRLLAGPTWYVDSAGTTQVGPRATSTVTSPFNVTDWSGGKGRFRVASEKLTDWQPGATFSTPVINTMQTVGMTEIEMTNDGQLRLTVLTTP